ncbi:type III pantothenate kinase [Paraglaciecola aquimarina]|uniref:Type III pantothenate kinase n=1 Tax=Paraglaciecola algarum TaxID=3050085 RepID=A0ABS9D441_9ALTE|nr:type III pantothenate kinase [Paraglaciecola sp. G1-23]
MSEPTKILLLDVGNTCIKYAWVSQLSITQTGIFDLESVDNFNFSEIQHCFVSAVGQSQKVGQLEELLQAQNIPVTFFKTMSKQLGLSCAYKDQSRLGVDRWLAMLACRGEYSGNFAVLDFGTAMTCDVVNSKGQHLGGWIAPGANTMQVALLKETEQLRAQQDDVANLSLGVTTEACINMGILASLQGFVLSSDTYMQKHFAQYQIFIGGGDQNKLAQLQLEHIQLFDDLVLKGMLELVKKTNITD